MQTVTVKSHEGLQHVVSTDSHALVADEPPPEGEKVLGPIHMNCCSPRSVPERP